MKYFPAGSLSPLPRQHASVTLRRKLKKPGWQMKLETEQVLLEETGRENQPVEEALLMGTWRV